MLNIGAAVTVLLVIFIALIIITKISMERFTTDGEWIMRHVDPAFGGGGLLIPVVRGGGGGGMGGYYGMQPPQSMMMMR
jgi:hypothetical protein